MSGAFRTDLLKFRVDSGPLFYTAELESAAAISQRNRKIMTEKNKKISKRPRRLYAIGKGAIIR
jgi:hypothetical protein